MGCTMDSIYAARWLSHATSSPPSVYPSYPYSNRNADVSASHTHGNANTNTYTYTFINANSGTAWLSKADGGLHACRGQRRDAQPAHHCDADPRPGAVWRRDR